jgi:predicted transcriptional regulator
MPCDYLFGMRATTIKLDGELYKKVGRLKPMDQSATAYVRALIEREHTQREQLAAAEAYRAFLEANPEERTALAGWEQAALVEAPKADEGPR